MLGRGRSKTVSSSTLADRDAEAMSQLGFAPASRGAAGYRVDGIMEAVTTASFDFPEPGQPVVVVGRHGHVLGSLADADAAVVKARPDLFKPLILPIAFPAAPKPAK